MKNKTILTWLSLAVVLAVSSCGGGPPAVPPVEQPAAQAPAAEALKEVLAFTLPATTPLADWTIPLRVAPLKAVHPYAFKLPADWPKDASKPAEVGVVEIGSGSKTPGQYLAAIDIDTVADTVSGLLASTTDSNVYRVDFQRIPQVVNPERGEGAKIQAFKDLPPPPAVAVAIRADSVCFVVNTKNDPPYIRYCSVPGSMLSVRENFGSQYASLQTSIQGAVDLLAGKGELDPNIQIEKDQIISEMENPTHIENCGEQIQSPSKAIELPAATPTEASLTLEFQPPQDAVVPGIPKPSLAFGTPSANTLAALQAACGSDITVASVTLDYYNQVKPTPVSSRPFMFSLLAPFLVQGNPPPVTVAVVQILQPVDTTLGTVFPGNYRLDYFFDASGNFFAATITGFLTGGTPVTNQPVPAVPATFVNQDNSESGGAQISTCRIFGRCTFFQSSCS